MERKFTSVTLINIDTNKQHKSDLRIDIHHHHYPSHDRPWYTCFSHIWLSLQRSSKSSFIIWPKNFHAAKRTFETSRTVTITWCDIWKLQPRTLHYWRVRMCWWQQFVYNARTVFYLTTRTTLHSNTSAWRQAQQRSPLFQRAVKRVPLILSHCTADNIKALLIMSEEGAGNIFLQFPYTHHI
jgi:hypothetical protein